MFDLLVSNLARLDEKEETDSQGIFHILGTFENLLSFMPPLSEQVVQETTLLKWLLDRIQVKAYDSNKQYASEILSILLQESRDNRLRLAEMDGMDALLKVLSVCRSLLTCPGREWADASRATISNTERKIQEMAKRSNSWRTFSTVCAPFSPSQSSRQLSSKLKEWNS